MIAHISRLTPAARPLCDSFPRPGESTTIPELTPRPTAREHAHAQCRPGSTGVPRLLRQEARPHGRRVQPRRAARRPDAAVHQRRHEPVQGRVPRHGHAALQAGGRYAEVHPGRRQAQRPRRRGQGHLPPHVFRDARQLVVRRLLQEGGDPLGVGAADGGVGPRQEPAARDRFRGRRGARPGAGRRGGGAVAVGDRHRPVTHP